MILHLQKFSTFSSSLINHKNCIGFVALFVSFLATKNLKSYWNWINTAQWKNWSATTSKYFQKLNVRNGLSMALYIYKTKKNILLTPLIRSVAIGVVVAVAWQVHSARNINSPLFSLTRTHTRSSCDPMCSWFNLRGDYVRAPRFAKSYVTTDTTQSAIHVCYRPNAVYFFFLFKLRKRIHDEAMGKNLIFKFCLREAKKIASITQIGWKQINGNREKKNAHK